VPRLGVNKVAKNIGKKNTGFRDLMKLRKDIVKIEAQERHYERAAKEAFAELGRADFEKCALSKEKILIESRFQEAVEGKTRHELAELFFTSVEESDDGSDDEPLLQLRKRTHTTYRLYE
jgi:hypothetical protein